METTANILRRRNGSQQACEPCRKGKIACDHALPVCGRCKRRKTFAQCQYINAPMSKARGPVGSVSVPPALSRRTSSTVSPVTSAGYASATWSPESRHDHSHPISGPFNKASGVYGSTNFSAIFLENQSTFQTDMSDIGEGLHDEDCKMGSVSAEEGSPAVKRHPRMDEAIKVLQKIPDRQTYEYLMEWSLDRLPFMTLHNPSIRYAVASLWDTFGSLLKEPRKVADIESVADVLFRNSEHALQDSEDYEGYLASFTGPNFRWEVIAIIFSRLGNAILSLPDEDPIYASKTGPKLNKRVLGQEYKDCCSICTELMIHGDMINTVMVGALLTNLSFQTFLSSDSSLIIWRQSRDIVSAATACGLHLEEDPTKPVTIVSELRKRLWMGIFGMDKGFASFNGRPPSLSHRYARCQMAYDLSDEVLMLPQEEIAKAVSELDASGWNLKDEMKSVTVGRANYIVNLVLDETLEISLGREQEVSRERIENLSSRLEVAYANFPPSLRYQKISSIPGNGFSGIRLRQMLVKMNYLSVQFHLHRLAIKHCGTGIQALVDCAVELLEMTVFLWINRDAFVQFHSDIDAILIEYGVPSSGVLSVELLKAMRDPNQPQVSMPRSDVVQNLSMVVGCLTWVRPTSPNYKICLRMRRIIKHVLDQILDPQPKSQQPDPQSFLYNELGGDYGSINYLENLDWIDTRMEGNWVPIESGFNFGTQYSLGTN